MAGQNLLRFRSVLDDKVSSGLDRIHGKFDTFGKSKGFKSVAMGVGMGAGFGAWGALSSAIDKTVDFIGTSITAASDLNETISKSEVIFGDSSKEVERWASTASRSFGQSKKDALDAASTFAGLFDTVGIEIDKGAPMAKKLTELGSDLASFFNTDVTQALEAVRSGLAGESEPLRRFNIFLSEAAVKAKAVEMGLVGSHDELTEGQKILARYQIILDQTTSAQGDFARTADGLANSQRTANAVLEDSQAALGQKFLPIALQVTQWQIDFIEGGELLLGTLGDMVGGVNDLVGGLGDLGRALLGGDGTTAAMNEAAKAATAYNETAEGTAEVNRETAKGLALLPPPIKKVGDAATTMGGKVDKATDKVVLSFDEMVRQLSGDVSDLIDDVYDPAIQHAELAATKEEAAAIRRAIASGKLTNAEVRESKRRLLTLTKDADETRLSLLESGNLSAADTNAWLNKLEKKYKSSTGDARGKIAALIRKIKELASTEAGGINIKVTGSTGEHKGKQKPRARGGPVWPGEAYTVGEGGEPETLVMGDRGGWVYPDGGRRAGGGSAPMTVHIHYSPQMSTASVSEAQRFVRTIGPEFTRWLRGQGYIAQTAKR